MRAIRHTQAGLSLSGLLFWCVVLGAVALVFMKLFPIYNEKIKVDMAMSRVGGNATATTTKTDLVKQLQKEFEVSDMNRFTDIELMKQLKVTHENTGARTMVLEYEIRGAFLGGLDVILPYSRTVPLPKGAAD